MCDFEKGFKLCTCDLAELDEDLKYTWRLQRPYSTRDDGLVGTWNMSTDDIGNGLNEEFVLKNLNQRNCFDFEYSPIERDNLTMESKSDYLSFVFTNGSWIIDSFNPFNIVVKQIHSGKIEPI